MDIKNLNDVRSAVSILTASCNAMCNAKTTDEIVTNFMAAKDNLIALYKYNVERVGGLAPSEN